MKTTGKVFIVIGALSFIGAAIFGHSVFGPLFWIGLGAYLVQRAEEKDNKNK